MPPVDVGTFPGRKTIISQLNQSSPDLIVIELGDGILGGYSVESIFDDLELRAQTAAIIFCASDYVGAWGGIELLRKRGIEIDVISGSVTDSQMGEDYVEKEFGVPAANAKRNGTRLFELIKSKVEAGSVASRAQLRLRVLRIIAIPRTKKTMPT